jgi:hypothetical protein
VSMGSVQRPSEWWTCDSKAVNLVELSPLTGNTEGSFEIQYRPLLLTAQPVEAVLTIITKELGSYKYRLILTTTPAAPRRILRFEVPLGGLQAETFLFRVFNTVKCDFVCTTKQPEIFGTQKVRHISPNSSHTVLPRGKYCMRPLSIH